ncbi:D-alanyl-D-alanine carboxypeptidase family protein [Thalassobius sp. S69A]|uniref:D-alanyl-D-alanine carboxypeptidase family protein n=1 Tax=unclassified Thalassovita TaxID=2619711 RepID=UPI000C0F437A|nr:D-alanyl-D-alanine carboxypeptidase [Paracoccaceae bacterium]MBT25771.1 D-alanyl-D-alanine carboxypeptidase [Paracoccaceae bacterium]
MKRTHWGLLAIAFVWLLIVVPASVRAAPYAAMVMDARTGEVLHSANADTRLHPASLTKMMTLYLAFQAVERGEISLDTMVRISRNAAAEPPSKLGLRAGQKIKLRYLIRAAAVKSANDAATAIGEAIEGSEAAFARRMNRTARAMGMTRTTFKNAHGLTRQGHLSTARDMTILGRHLLYDYPQYYNLFGRKTTDAGLRTVNNTNRKFLSAYRGADGIKTGYTRAAGFNLVASAERGRERVIATVFGGRSTATRNAKVAELLDLGFRRAPSRVALRKPAKPGYTGSGPAGTPGGSGKTIRLVTAVKQSLRPHPRPGSAQAPVLVAVKDDINDALKEVMAEKKPATAPPALPKESLPVQLADTNTPTPRMRPSGLVLASTGEQKRAVEDALASAAVEEREVVTRLSTSGGRHWGINVGRYPSSYAAEKVLVKTALAEMATLEGSLRKVVNRKGGFDANFMGLTREKADLACRRLQARQVTCFMIGPG